MSAIYYCRYCKEQHHYYETMTACPTCVDKRIAELESTSKLNLAQAQIKHEENVALKAAIAELQFRIDKMREGNWEQKEV